MSPHAEHSPDPGAASPSTAVTTPEESFGVDNDIWESDGHDEDTSRNRPARHELLSDLPTIKRQHMTDGYREGLSVGKAKVMQQGFDEGYPIGTQIALRVGLVLGVLEGYLASKTSHTTQDRASLQRIYDKAKEELSCPALLKDIGDDLIANATTIPACVDTVIFKWEHSVLGMADTSNA